MDEDRKRYRKAKPCPDCGEPVMYGNEHGPLLCRECKRLIRLGKMAEEVSDEYEPVDVSTMFQFRGGSVPEDLALRLSLNIHTIVGNQLPLKIGRPSEYKHVVGLSGDVWGVSRLVATVQRPVAEAVHQFAQDIKRLVDIHYQDGLDRGRSILRQLNEPDERQKRLMKP